jgi:hypothetical protein
MGICLSILESDLRTDCGLDTVNTHVNVINVGTCIMNANHDNEVDLLEKSV